MRYIVASGPVIVEKGKVLLDKHGKDKFWKFPGGKIKRGESLEQCAIKRAKEELGINVKLVRPIKPMILWKKGEVVVLIHYLAKRKGKIKPGRHVREFAWINTNKLPKDIAKNIRPVLREMTL